MNSCITLDWNTNNSASLAPLSRRRKNPRRISIFSTRPLLSSVSSVHSLSCHKSGRYSRRTKQPVSRQHHGRSFSLSLCHGFFTASRTKTKQSLQASSCGKSPTSPSSWVRFCTGKGQLKRIDSYQNIKILPKKYQNDEYLRHADYEQSEDHFYNEQYDKQLNKVLSEPWWYGLIKFIAIILFAGFVMLLFDLIWEEDTEQEQEGKRDSRRRVWSKFVRFIVDVC